MKPKNFPARKLQRQINAGRDMSKTYTDHELLQLEHASTIRTKKRRTSRSVFK
jgi:hypothetical protein